MADGEVEFALAPEPSPRRKGASLTSFFKFKGFKVFRSPGRHAKTTPYAGAGRPQPARAGSFKRVAPASPDAKPAPGAAREAKPAARSFSPPPTYVRRGSGRESDADPLKRRGTSEPIANRDSCDRKASGGVLGGRSTASTGSLADERQDEQRKQQRQFFDEMERNMRRNFARGLAFVDLGPAQAVPQARPGVSADGRGHRRSAPGMGAGPKAEAAPLRGISTVDDSFLHEASRPRKPKKEAPRKSGLRSPKRRPSLTSANSTNTLHVDSTLADPDIAALVRCVCRVLHAHMTTPAPAPGEKLAPADRAKLRAFVDVSANAEELAGYLPSLGEMTEFFRMVFRRGEMHVECIVTALVFIERLLRARRGHLQLGADNWRPVVFSTMILASKVCDDESPLNADWCYVCSDFTLTRINELETALLSAYGFNATVSASEYANYYFNLRSMAARLGLMAAHTLGPLDITVARRIADSSHSYPNPHNSNRKPLAAYGRQGPRRSASFHDRKPPQRRPSASLEQVVSMQPQFHGSGEHVRSPPRRRGSV